MGYYLTFESVGSSPTIMASELESRWTGTIRSFREALKKAVNEVAMPSITRNFQVGGRPKWAANASSTTAKKSSARPLINTGKMAKSAGRQARWSFSMDEARWRPPPLVGRNGFPYPSLHQIGGKDVPARPYGVLQQEDVEKIERIFADWIEVRMAGG